MPVVITPLGLGNVRRTDPSPQVTINGSGFSATPGQNQVYVSGSLAAIVTESAVQITFNLPAPFSLNLYDLRDLHVPVVVVNLDTGERSDDAYVWIKGDVEEVADEPLDTPIPGVFEQPGDDEQPDRFEARDMFRLGALIEALITDIQTGNVLAWDGSKLAEPAGLKGSGAGQLLLVDAGEPTSLKWGFKADAFLEFGGISAFAAPTVFLGAGVNSPGAPGTENWALADGVLDTITLRVRTSAGAALDRVRVLVNGVAAYDSGPGLATTNWTQAINVPVVEGDKIELEVTQTLVPTSSVQYVGGIRLLVD